LNGFVCVRSIGINPKSLVFGQVISNGRYKSIEHRAVANKEKEAEIGPACELINESNPLNYRNFKRREYLESYFLEGKKAIEFAKINPSSAG
jgi:hypothetical protein